MLIEFDRHATVTIQGGGVYGLNLLGQLAELVDVHRIIPIALAGNSAGAIIATLYWAGLTPEDIKDKFVEACGLDPERGRSRLMDLLGPFDSQPGGGPFNFDQFLALKSRFDGYLSTLDSHLKGGDELTSSARIKPLLWHVEKFCRYLSTVLQAKRASDDVSVHVENKGIFRGEEFEVTIDRWIRSSPKLVKFSRSPALRGFLPPPIGEPDGRLLTFDDLLGLQDLPAPLESESVFFPPLFLTATNLTKRRLEVITSFEGDHGHWPVARAVRASAGFPVFFRPVGVDGRPAGCWYVDGGIISNFPSWVFGPKFRTSMAGPTSVYSALASFPWLNIGLRVVDDAGPAEDRDALLMPPHPLGPKEFLDAMVGLASGRARSEIEDRLSTFVPRSRAIRQPISQTSGPENLLAFHRIDPRRVEAMYRSGRRAAARCFAEGDYFLPDESRKMVVVDHLRKLAERAWSILRPPGSARRADEVFRANVYLPHHRKLHPWCAWNMEGAVDAGLTFELGAGLTGYCHSRRCPLICNLRTIDRQYVGGNDEAVRFFGMVGEEQRKVDRSRTWLASFPIYDPCDLGLHQAPTNPRTSDRPYYCEVETPVQAGAVFGVVNLDAAIDYDELGLHVEPARCLTDDRIGSMIPLMQSVAFAIGQILSESYPDSSRTRGR